MAHPEEPQSPDIQAQDNDYAAWDKFYEDVIQFAWQPALQFVLDNEGAPERCKRRVCRISGTCHITPHDGEPLDCGGGASVEAVKRAAEHVGFLYIMARSFIQGLGISSPGFAGFLLGMNIQPPNAPADTGEEDVEPAA